MSVYNSVIHMHTHTWYTPFAGVCPGKMPVVGEEIWPNIKLLGFLIRLVCTFLELKCYYGKSKPQPEC